MCFTNFLYLDQFEGCRVSDCNILDCHILVILGHINTIYDDVVTFYIMHTVDVSPILSSINYTCTCTIHIYDG